MNKLEQKMMQAVKNKTAFKQTNTEVKHCNGNTYIKLYNTYIYVELNGVKYYSDGGWATRTTASRLRALGAKYSINPAKREVELVSQSTMRFFVNENFKSL